MADLSLKPVGADIKPMPTMSLGEMINFARGAQQYQQGGITLSLEQQKERERNAMTQFLSKPENYQTNGRIDINKLNAAIPSLAPLTGAEYISSLTGLSTAQSESSQKNIALTLDQQKEKERFAMQQFLSKPENYQTNGRVDINKLNAEITKIAPLTGAEYISSLTGLSTAQSQAGTAGIALTLDEQKQNERKAIENYLKNPQGIAKHQTDIGLNVDAATKDILQLAPITGPDYVAKISSIETANVQAKKAAQDLTQDQRGIIGSALGLMGRLGIKDKKSYIQELDDLVLKNPNNPSFMKLVDAYKITLQTLPENADLPSLAISAANSLLSVGTQQEKFAPQPGTANTGAATFVTTTRPSVAGEVPTVSVAEKPLVTAQLPPGSREVPTGSYDINNNPIVNVYGPDGRFLGQRAASGTPPITTESPRPVVTSQAPAAEPVARLPAGETIETRQAADKIRLDASNAAKEVPMQTFNNNKIIKLADDVITGKGANFIGALSGGYAGLPFTTDNATNLNQLGHYMALQTASLSASSGLGGTDAARGIAGQISGTTDWTAPAIKQTARVNRALTTATELFNQGVQKSFEKNKDPFSARDFQNKWSQTVDINAIRLYDAMKNSDNEAIREIVNEAGGKDSPGYKRLIENIGKTKKLLGGQ
jgi:hypothetical protein